MTPKPALLASLVDLELVPAPVLAQLAGSDDVKLRRVVATARELPAAIVDRLASDADWRVRVEVAQRRDLAASLAERLVADPRPDVREQIAANPATPIALLESVGLVSARHPDAPVSWLERLADHASIDARADVARHARTPLAVLQRLATDSETRPRECVLANPRTPLAIMQQIQRGLPPASRFAFNWNPDITLELASALLGRPTSWREMIDDSRWDVVGLGKSKHLPLEHFAELARNDREHTRFYVAQNPRTPRELIAKLLGDAKPLVRRAAYAVASAEQRAAARAAKLARAKKDPFVISIR